MPRKKSKPSESGTPNTLPAESLDFAHLVDAIRQVHEHCAAHASRAVNVNLTLRNWVIGAYIREYEQKGADRAQYGEGLLGKLAKRLKGEGLERMDERELRRYRLFYMTYPGIRESLSPEFKPLLPISIWQTLSAKSTPGALEAPNRESLSPDLGASLSKLFTSLSFSHLAEFIAIDDPLKRAFYEIECIRGNGSVRALKRQIATLYSVQNVRSSKVGHTNTTHKPSLRRAE